MQPNAPAKNPGNPPGIGPQGLKDLWDYNFTNHKPTAEGLRRIEGLRSAAKALKDAIVDMCPPGRSQALALTSLEQMLFHATAAIARAMNEDLVPETPEEDRALDNPTKDKEK